MYRVKLSKQGYQELLTLRGNPKPGTPGLTRNRGGFIGIGRDWVLVDENEYDIEAIKNDVLVIRKDTEIVSHPKPLKWFDVEKVSEKEGRPRDNGSSNKRDLLTEAETELAEDAEIAEEVKPKKKRGRPRKT